MNFFELVSLGATLLSALSSAFVQLSSGQTVELPPIRTYVSGHHVELDVTVKPLS